MPWKVCKPMDERLKFVARVLEGEQMAGLCREFGISRKTGYKLVDRYNDSGLEALTDRSRRPYRQANKLPFRIETLIVRLKEDKPLGCAEDPRTLETALSRCAYPCDQHRSCGARSTRAGEATKVSTTSRRGNAPFPSPFSQ